MAQTFGERLRVYRLRKNLTPGELAHAAGVSEGAIRQMESGQTKSASFVVGLRIAATLGISPWLLATGRDGGADPAESRRPRERHDQALVEAVALLNDQVRAVDRRVRLLEAELRRERGRKASG